MRLFIAALLPEDTEYELRAIRDRIQKHSERCSPTPDENLHITLSFLGECNELERDRAICAIRELPDFKLPIRLRRTDYLRRDDGKLWLVDAERAKALMSIQEKLTENLRMNGFRPEGRRFRPHITLARRTIGTAEPETLSIDSYIVSIDLMLSERIGGRMIYTSLFSKEALRSAPEPQP